MSDLDSLHETVKLLDTLLKDRHPGLVTWNIALSSLIARLDRIYQCLLQNENSRLKGEIRDLCKAVDALGFQ